MSSEHPQVLNLLEALFDKVRKCDDRLSGQESIQSAYQHVSLILDNDQPVLMKGLAEFGLAGELRSLQSLLGQKLNDLQQVLNEDPRSSNIKQRYIKEALKVLDSSIQESSSWRVV